MYKRVRKTFPIHAKAKHIENYVLGQAAIRWATWPQKAR